MKNKKFKPLIITGIVLGSLVLLYGILFLVNVFCNLHLRNFIAENCPKIEINMNAEIKTDEDGHYYFKMIDDNKDFKVVQLTDIHFGGGFLSVKKDEKTILDVYQVLKTEKPDLVILTGDNIFAIPYISGTFNNKMASKTIAKLFSSSGVYFTTAFGNHDTEVFDYTNRVKLGKMYEDLGIENYSLFKSESSTKGDNGLYSVSNQLLYLESSAGELLKAFMVIDTNAYKDDSIKSVLDWTYDTIREEDIINMKNALDKVKEKHNVSTVQTLFFFHIPLAEYEIAYEDLVSFENNKYVIKDTEDSKYLGGLWDEIVEDNYGDIEGNDIRIWYGGSYDNTDIKNKDQLFETFESDMIACFCGHDHVNNATVSYKGKVLSYGYSIDNLAYSDIDKSGRQRGSTLITINKEKIKIEHKNLYLDLNRDTDGIYTDKEYYNSESLSDSKYDFKDSMAGSISANDSIIYIDKDGAITSVK